MIFISDFDPFDKNKVHYEVAHYVKDTDLEYDNGIHIHYFNTAVDDGTFLSELLQYLKHSDPNNNRFGALSKQVNIHKVKNEGVDTMCKMMEDFAKRYSKPREEQAMLKGKIEGKIKGKIETIKNMLKMNIPFEAALECAQIDKETYEKYAEQL